LRAEVEKSSSGIVFVFGPGNDLWQAEVKHIARQSQHQLRCTIISQDSSVAWDSADSKRSLPLSAFPNEPFLAAVEEGESPRFYTGTLDDMEKSSKKIADWILSNDVPLLSELGPHNFRRIGKLGKLLAMAIVDPQNETTPTYLANFKNVARDLTLEVSESKIAEKFVFGHLDGIEWAEFIQQFNVYGGLPRVVVVDAPAEKFYEDSSVDELDEIDTFLREVTDGKVPAQKEGLKSSFSRFFEKAKAMGFKFYLMLLPCLIFPILACSVSPGRANFPFDSDVSKRD
jgi:hypothetical protein